jgi:hypothetical protein
VHYSLERSHFLSLYIASLGSCITAAAAAATATATATATVAGTANSAHRAAAEGACGLLRNLCAGSATAKTAAGDAGACSAVVACLVAFKGDSRLQLAALAAARNLGGGHAGNRAKLVRTSSTATAMS